jgi:ubiquinone/menaquinone biosynthesis C-methylase UbiE
MVSDGRPVMAQAFDELSGRYDDAYHDEIARALIGFVAPLPGESVVDVASGTGAVALAVAQDRVARGGGAPVLAVDLSAGMVKAGRERAARLGLTSAITWIVADAVPLPVADRSMDVLLCASSLHFLGSRALDDWLRVLRPGGRAGFTMPVASQFRPGGVFADLVATDLRLPETAEDARRLADNAGFSHAAARTMTVGARTVVLVTGEAPAP